MKSTIRNVRIAGVAAAVPRYSQSILESDYSTPEGRQKFIDATGIENRRLGPKSLCTSDLAFEAATKLIDDLGWKRDEIDLLIFLTQTPDYILPATAIVLQDRLGLSKECAAFDINLGCSAYPYGIATIAGMISGAGFRKALMLVGDTSSKGTMPSNEEATPPLFGDCGTATAIEWAENAPDMHIHLANDGKGYGAIIHKYGGYRNLYTKDTLKYEEMSDGTIAFDTGFKLDGFEILNFSMREVPPSVRTALELAQTNIEDVDYFVFHQANKMINEMVCKKLKIPAEKAPSTLKQYANTSSATIPLTIVSELGEQLKTEDKTLLLCGFGVGLSWGTVICKTDGIVCPKVIEV